MSFQARTRQALDSWCWMKEEWLVPLLVLFLSHMLGLYPNGFIQTLWLYPTKDSARISLRRSRYGLYLVLDSPNQGGRVLDTSTLSLSDVRRILDRWRKMPGP